MRAGIIRICVIFPFILLSCKARPVLDFLALEGGADFEPERALVEEALKDASALESLGLRLFDPETTGQGKKKNEPGIIISFHSSWEFEKAWGDLLLSRSWYTPREHCLAGRRDTSLEACIEGRETLIPLEGLEPPCIALKVGGLAIGDENYPLVKTVGIAIKEVGSGKVAQRRLEKIPGLENLLREKIKPLGEKPDLVWIAAAGDMMLGRGAQDILFREGARGVFGKTGEILAKSDIRLVNFEGTLTSRNNKAEKTFTFSFNPKIAVALKDAGIDAVLFANNHAFDFGREGFLETLSHLENAGIVSLGAGRNQAAAAEPWVFRKGNFTARVFGLASFYKEVSGWDGMDAVAGQERAGFLHASRGGGELIKPRFSQDDGLDIVLVHGGDEWSAGPDRKTRLLFSDLVNSGADLVIGSHPHIVQGFEWIEGKPVFWSLGNFVFAGMENTGGGDRGLLVSLGYWGSRLVYLEPHALALSGPKTEIAGEEGLAVFYERSRELYRSGEYANMETGDEE
ncbi:CapA family protein [Leadbettera azotonutricia]|uniref:Bacterial capsule synthesis protein n=1 Tax=Leadbettera azotonutricia (strain ATCC BAA-888 / DSM 13862 / ZAS-9) TaxID=545695 RepID=F5YAI4_LEAAZ|nr:CapA family protein [Leadbettera azotonutricia]AEF81591.1 bacterial capsule synthesis protein [Leadbettera azotonutricia ZAS-9]